MKTLGVILAGLALIGGLAACSTQTAYQPATGANAIGYRDYAIESNRYRVTFRANSVQAAEDFALRRAAELTVREGYDWFRVVSRNNDETNRSASPRISVGGSTGGNVRIGGGIGIGLDTFSGGQAISNMEVLMGTDPRPDGVNVYDARGVMRNIGPQAAY